MGRTGIETRNRLKRAARVAVNDWIDSEGMGGSSSDKHGWAMPREDADGCPGWVRR